MAALAWPVPAGASNPLIRPLPKRGFDKGWGRKREYAFPGVPHLLGDTPRPTPMGVVVLLRPLLPVSFRVKLAVVDASLLMPTNINSILYYAVHDRGAPRAYPAGRRYTSFHL